MNDPGMSTCDEQDAKGAEAEGIACSVCGAPLVRGVSLAESEDQPVRWKCLRCACFDRTLATRSGRVALVVGSVLIAVNQGDQLLSGSFPFATAWWKLPLTYLVPFLVASYGAISNGYRPVPRVRGSSAPRPREPLQSE